MRFFLLVFLITAINAPAQTKPGAQAVPTKQQLASQETPFYLFAHFGPNTFTDKEWGEGTEAEDVFNPANLDCRQWCRVAKAAGATGIIITAKHHDGFCLWPSKYSTHTVRESKWKNGKGDVLKELSRACKEYGLKFGVYISPWDRNHPKYGTAAYNDVFVNMMKELFTNYGPIWELWWDGANGEGPNGKKQVYDWRRFISTVRKLSPNTVVFSDVGPDLRWCGNENGIAGKTNWNYLDTAGFTPGASAPSTDTLNRGNINGRNWIPAECDVSIRPGWFYHPEEDQKAKTPDQLFQLYLKSVGRGANLLLNVPPDRIGRISAFDSAALVGFKELREELSPIKEIKAKISITSGDSAKLGNTVLPFSITAPQNEFVQLDFSAAKRINCVVVKEQLALGQHCKKFRLTLLDEKFNQLTSIEGTTIGNVKIITFPTSSASIVQFQVLDQQGTTTISDVHAYLIPEQLIEK